MSESKQRNLRRTMVGTVISAKTQNTVTVEIERTFKHARYGKYLRRKKRYLAHDAESIAREGDLVQIVSCRPMSKLKRWRVTQVLEHSDLAEAAQSPDRELAAAAEAAQQDGGDA